MGGMSASMQTYIITKAYPVYMVKSWGGLVGGSRFEADGNKNIPVKEKTRKSKLVWPEQYMTAHLLVILHTKS